MQISIILLGKLINFFIMILLGFILVNKNILKSSDSRILSIIVVYLVMPCAIIGSFEIDFTKEKLQGLLFSAVIAVIIHVLLLIFINTQSENNSNMMLLSLTHQVLQEIKNKFFQLQKTMIG